MTNSNIRAAKELSPIWGGSCNAPDNHPYLIRKGIKSNGAKIHNSLLVLPVLHFTKEIINLQFIDCFGKISLLTNKYEKGCFIPVRYKAPSHKIPIDVSPNNFADIADTASGFSKIIITVDWSTACTLAERNTSAMVLASIDIDNLEVVATIARSYWMSADIIIIGDDDRLLEDQSCSKKTLAAAIAADAILVTPRRSKYMPKYLTNFNDLVRWSGKRTI